MLLIVGYALIYLPWIADAGHFEVPGGRRHPIADAVYFSGVSLATLGYGDITPISVPFRLLSVLEALNGLVVITLSITFLLTVYPSLLQKQALAAALNEASAGRVDAVPMVARYLQYGNWEALATRIVSNNEQVLSIAEAHRVHSVLYYSHPVEPERSLVRTLLLLRGLVATVRFGLHEDGVEPSRAHWDDPRIRTLEDSFGYMLRVLAHSIHVRLVEEIADDDESRGYLRKEYSRLRSELYRLGLISSEEGGAEEEFIAFRLSADNYINAYRKHSAYDSAEVDTEPKPPVEG